MSHCGRAPSNCMAANAWDDVDRVRNELEAKQRQLRIKQVREESKKLSRKLCKDVAKEKDRQLRNLEAIKAKELDCWRQHVLAQKAADYNCAIYQVGTAHRCAEQENWEAIQRKNSQKQNCPPKTPRRPEPNKENQRPAARPSVRNKTTAVTKMSIPPPRRPQRPPPPPRKLPVLAGKSTAPRSAAAPPPNSPQPSQKSPAPPRKKLPPPPQKSPALPRKSTAPAQKAAPAAALLPSTSRHSSAKARAATECLSISSESDDDDFFATAMENDKTSSSTSTNEEPAKAAAPTSVIYARTTPIIVDVDVRSNDSVTITTPCEVSDKHVECNRKFDAVIDISPRRRPSDQVQHEPAERVKKAAAAAADDGNQAPPTKPRFTQISDFVSNKRQPSRQPARPADAASKSAEAVADKPTGSQSPTLRNRSASATARVSHLPAAEPAKPASAPTSARAETRSPRSSPRKTSVSAASAPAKPPQRPNPESLVRFYDYNNKYDKSYPQSAAVVKRNSAVAHEPNATTLARAENDAQQERERELEQLQRRSDDRGRNALDREQVRRDCLALTEKLETLTRKLPEATFIDSQLLAGRPPPVNVARREERSNKAVEEILLRPAIITCPPREPPRATKTAESIQNALAGVNVAATGEDNRNSTTSSDSCCSILLGYVDDQGKQIRSEMKRTTTTADGQTAEQACKLLKLQNLLERVNKLRQMLLRALQENAQPANQDNMNQLQGMLDSVNTLRREHKKILSADVRNDRRKPVGPPAGQKTTTGREVECVSASSEDVILKRQLIDRRPSGPIEIVVRLKRSSKKRSSAVPAATKQPKKPTNSKVTRKVSPLVQYFATKKAPLKTIAAKTNPRKLNRGNSVDSGSTSYRSLPSRIGTDLDKLKTAVSAKPAPCVRCPSPKKTPAEPRPTLNPLVAHYVQRLLCMSRTSIQALGVSSSDIETPSSTLINTTSNCTEVASAPHISEDRLMSVRQFIVDNRAFVDDLQSSIDQQKSRESAEHSMRLIEQAWQECLAKKQKHKANAAATAADRGKTKQKTSGPPKTTAPTAAPTTAKVRERSPPKRRPSVPAITPADREKSKQKACVDKGTMTAAAKVDEGLQVGPPRSPSKHLPPTSSKTAPGSASTSLVESPSGGSPKKCVQIQVGRQASQVSTSAQAEAQIARYEQLTTNCTHRITELTELIQRVRQEKHRLLEVTLSSVSDNGRTSTEYLELSRRETVKTTTTTHDPQVAASSSSSSSSALDSSELRPSLNEAAPLEKHRPIGHSLDSGISMTQPVTQLPEPQTDLPSIASSKSASNSVQRKCRPPPTLRRFSPIEDDVVHELSTIIEVDTPANTRTHIPTTTSSSSSSEHTLNVATERDSLRPPSPRRFPTFEDYLRELNVDVSQMDPELSGRIQSEFDEICRELKECEAKNTSRLMIKEFPSLSAYLQQQAQVVPAAPAQERSVDSGRSRSQQQGTDSTVDTLEDLLNEMKSGRLGYIPSEAFPSFSDYMRQRKQNDTPGEQDSPCKGDDEVSSETVSESLLDIEEELIRRNILKGPLRSSEKSSSKGKDAPKKTSQRSSSDEVAVIYSRLIASESGVEKMSSSSDIPPPDPLTKNYYADLGRKTVSLERGQAMAKNAASQNRTVSSSTSSPSKRDSLAMPDPPHRYKHYQHNMAAQSTLGNLDKECAMSFREFITKELLKHAQSPSSSSSTDDTLKSQFLHSIADCLTPKVAGQPGKEEAVPSASRGKKTSTPKMSVSSGQANSRHSSTMTQLFSGESNLSSVRHQNETGK